jgi:hypothetical protein
VLRVWQSGLRLIHTHVRAAVALLCGLWVWMAVVITCRFRFLCLFVMVRQAGGSVWWLAAYCVVSLCRKG